HLARLPRTCPARTHATPDFGHAVTGHPRVFLAGSACDLYPRPGAVPAGRGDPPALPGPLWAADVSSCAGRVSRGARARGATPGLGAARARPCLARGGISDAGQHLLPSGGVRRGPGAPRAVPGPV